MKGFNFSNNLLTLLVLLFQTGLRRQWHLPRLMNVNLETIEKIINYFLLKEKKTKLQ